MWRRLQSAPAAAALAAAFAAGTALAATPSAPAAQMVTPAALSSATAPSVGADYLIGPDDQLNVTVFQIGELSRQVQVDSGGNIRLPLIGELKAAGLTPSALSDQIAADLKQKYVKDPLVTVAVTNAVSQRVTVDGAVVSPGIYPIAGPTTLLQAVALAKGPEPKSANEHKVALYRLVDGTRYGAIYDLAAIRAGRAPDPSVRGRDIIVVPTSGLKTVWHEFLSVGPIVALGLSGVP